MSKKIKCNFCGKIINTHSLLMPGIVSGSFCSVRCYKKFLEKPKECFNKKQKHEKIEKIALDLYKIFLGNPPIVNKKQLIKSEDILRFCWYRAEEFYNYAKEKEKKGIECEIKPNPSPKNLNGDKCVYCGKKVGKTFCFLVKEERITCSEECADKFLKEKEEGSKSDKKFPKCYVCGQKLIGDIYAVDICGHKYCSEECVLEAEGIDAKEKEEGVDG